MIDFSTYLIISTCIIWLLLNMEYFGWATAVVIIITIIAVINSPLKELRVRTNVTEIHSTAGSYNNITGQFFFLGSGYIKSEEMYTGNTFDGTYYNRIYIPVKSTQRREVGYLTNKAIYKQPICKYEDTLFKQTYEFNCKRHKATLEVPKGTIIQQLNFQ